MSLTLAITISGDQQTINKLKKLGQELFTFQAAMESIGASLESYFANQVFASQGGALDAKWAPLNAKYRLRKARQFPGRGTLVRTGRMQRSFTHIAKPNSVTIGNTASYFAYHQSSAPRHKLPRREMLGINNNVKTLIADIVNADVRKKIEDAGL